MSEWLFAEDVGHYWQTSKSSPDIWIDRAKAEIEAVGGSVLREGFGRDTGGRAAFMLEFQLDGELFAILWQVLPSSTGNERAAKVQAATALYHDVKARCISSLWIGRRAAFFSYLELPDGRTTSQLATPELALSLPRFLLSSGKDIEQH
jgi:hypothetical protein